MFFRRVEICLRVICFGLKMFKASHRFLRASSQPNAEAVRRRIASLYPELRRAAQGLLSFERANHTLQPTALANEAAAKLLVKASDWTDRNHFVASATRVMRDLLTDYARRRLAEKRQASNFDYGRSEEPRAVELLALDRLLQRLSEIDRRAAQVVEYRFYGGLSDVEIASALKLSVTTVQRDWEFARTWLYGELAQP